LGQANLTQNDVLKKEFLKVPRRRIILLSEQHRTRSEILSLKVVLCKHTIIPKCLKELGESHDLSFIPGTSSLMHMDKIITGISTVLSP
jgi:hypothetical protein